MKQRQYRQVAEAERSNFYRCPACREMVDRRRMDEVIIHHSHVLHPYRWHFDGREAKPRRSQPAPSAGSDAMTSEAEG